MLLDDAFLLLLVVAALRSTRIASVPRSRTIPLIPHSSPRHTPSVDIALGSCAAAAVRIGVPPPPAARARGTKSNGTRTMACRCDRGVAGKLERLRVGAARPKPPRWRVLSRELVELNYAGGLRFDCCRYGPRSALQGPWQREESRDDLCARRMVPPARASRPTAHSSAQVSSQLPMGGPGHPPAQTGLLLLCARQARALETRER